MFISHDFCSSFHIFLFICLSFCLICHSLFCSFLLSGLSFFLSVWFVFLNFTLFVKPFMFSFIHFHYFALCCYFSLSFIDGILYTQCVNKWEREFIYQATKGHSMLILPLLVQLDF